MPSKLDDNENAKLDALFGRELNIKERFKDRLIHQHLKRDRKKETHKFDEPSENSMDDFGH